MVVRTSKTNSSTAFADASGSANSKMGDSFAKRSEGPNKAALSRATDDSDTARGRNKARGHDSVIFDKNQKLDTGRGKVEGSETKRVIKERNATEKSKDGAMIQASNDSHDVMVKAKARMESSSTDGIITDKAKRNSWGTTMSLKADVGALAKASNEGAEGRGACKTRNVESKVLGGTGSEAPVRSGRAHVGTIKANEAVKMQSCRTTAADRAVDEATSKQVDDNVAAQRAAYAKNHASHVFTDTPPKATGRSDGRKNAGVSGGIFADEKLSVKTARAMTAQKHTSNDIFTDKPAPGHKACRAAVHDKNAGADVFKAVSAAEAAPKSSRAGMQQDKNAGANVFSDAKPEHKMSRAGVSYSNKGSDVFSDGKWEARHTISSQGVKNRESHNIFKDNSAPPASKAASNPKNIDHGIFSGGVFAQEAAQASAAAAQSRPQSAAPSRPTSSAGRPCTSGGGNMTARDHKSAMLRGSGSLW